MRILFVRSFPIETVSRYNIQEIGLIKALSKRTDAALLTGEITKTDARAELRSLDLPLIQVPVLRIGRTQQILRGIKQVLQEFAPDVVVVGADNQLSCILTARQAEKLGIKVWFYQGLYQTNSLKDLLLSRIIDFFAKDYVNGVFAKTQLAGNYMKLRRYNRVAVTGVGLDVEKYNIEQGSLKDKKHRLYGDENAVCLLHVGELSERRNANITLDILIRVLEEVENSIAIVIGDGPYFSQYKDKHPRLRLIGRMPQNEIPGFYEAADIFVNAYTNEIFGMAILEALYFGCRCFCFGGAAGPSYLKTIFEASMYLLSSLEPRVWAECIMGSLNTLEPRVRSIQADLIEWESVAQRYLDELEE